MFRRVVIGAVLLAAASAMAQPAAKPIVVSAPWLRATPKGASVAGGYATIANRGTSSDTLVGASLSVAATGEIHSMTMDHGIMHMSRLEHGLAIAPGATVTLAPGGDHLMFLRPRSQLRVGQTIAGTLTFARAGTIPVTFEVAGMAAKSAPRVAPSDASMPGMDMHSTH